ncbi:MAG: DUF6537 domain-containing protein, partial [Paracoccaceae bacterium]
LKLSLQARLGDRLTMFDAFELAKAVMGDSIYSNMMMLGAAWQRGLVPLTRDAILRAVELNGAAVERNKRAFEVGRWAVENPAEVEKVLSPQVVALPKSLDDRIAFRADHLVAYQSKRLAKRYRRLIDRVADARLKEAVAKGYHKVLTYKDEYEVARLMQDTEAKARAEFDGDLKLTYLMAPPLLSRTGPDGRPKKRAFGGWIVKALSVLPHVKALRGTPFDPFGWSAERRMERGLIHQYEADMAEVLKAVTEDTIEAAVALAELPLQIRGFGPVKAANYAKAMKRRDELLAALRAGGAPLKAAAE